MILRDHRSFSFWKCARPGGALLYDLIRGRAQSQDLQPIRAGNSEHQKRLQAGALQSATYMDFQGILGLLELLRHKVGDLY